MQVGTVQYRSAGEPFVLFLRISYFFFSWPPSAGASCVEVRVCCNVCGTEKRKSWSLRAPGTFGRCRTKESYHTPYTAILRIYVFIDSLTYSITMSSLRSGLRLLHAASRRQGTQRAVCSARYAPRIQPAVHTVRYFSSEPE